MGLIGIITEAKSIKHIVNSLRNYVKSDNIIYITENNINNIRNIKFNIIIINKKINISKQLKELISNAKYILLNEDIENNYNLINDMSLRIITFGYNPKSTITASSILNDEVLISIQRNILDSNGKKIEMQETNVRNDAYLSIYDLMFIECIKKIYKNC